MSCLATNVHGQEGCIKVLLVEDELHQGLDGGLQCTFRRGVASVFALGSAGNRGRLVFVWEVALLDESYGL